MKQEESLLRENKQEFLLKHKRLREQQTEVERNQANIDANQDILPKTPNMREIDINFFG